MKIQSNQYNFGNTYSIQAKNKEQADRLDLILNTNYVVDRKNSSKKMVIMPIKQYNEFLKVSDDIASIVYPQEKYSDEPDWKYSKLKTDLMNQILEDEKKNAIDIKI